MTWKERYADKLRTPEEAVKVVKNGDLVGFGGNSPWMDCWALTSALAKRAPELRDVTISGGFSLAVEVLLLGAGTEESWKYLTRFCMTPECMDKLTKRSKQIDLIPLSSFTTDLMSGPFRQGLAGRMVPNVALVTCTPPDKNGLVTFSAHLWGVRRLIQGTKLGGGIVVGEVNDTLPIVPGGDNWMSVDAFDYLVEATPVALSSMTDRLMAPSPPDVEEKEAVICAQVAELINDGDTIMLGGGRIPMKMGPFLEHKVDLGCHTEFIVPLDLMKKGVINNKRRNLVPGKTSCTAVAYRSEEEEEYVDGNPLFDIRDLGVNNHPRYIHQNENMVAVNAPLEITLFGEIGMERVGRRYFRGVGGQVEFVLGTLMARNGRSIHATLSTATTPDGVVSRIVPQLAYPAVSSIPRQFVDFIVTEHGIASLLGKTEREKANELIAVADPEFRPWLREEVKKLYLD